MPEIIWYKQAMVIKKQVTASRYFHLRMLNPLLLSSAALANRGEHQQQSEHTTPKLIPTSISTSQQQGSYNCRSSHKRGVKLSPPQLISGSPQWNCWAAPGTGDGNISQSWWGTCSRSFVRLLACSIYPEESEWILKKLTVEGKEVRWIQHGRRTNTSMNTN